MVKRKTGSRAYAGTSTEVAVTQYRDITGLFAKYGITKWQFSQDDEEGFAVVRFRMAPKRWYRVMLKAPIKEGRTKPRRGRKPKVDPKEQAKRMVWRALYNWLKVQFEAIEYGVFSPQEAFLGWMEIPTKGGGMTVAEALIPHLDDLPKLLGPG